MLTRSRLAPGAPRQTLCSRVGRCGLAGRWVQIRRQEFEQKKKYMEMIGYMWDPTSTNRQTGHWKHVGGGSYVSPSKVLLPLLQLSVVWCGVRIEKRKSEGPH